MKEYTLTREQAVQIKKDYNYVVGQTYTIKGSQLRLTEIVIEEIGDTGAYTVTVNFDLIYGSWRPSTIIDLFLIEVGIPFDLLKYVESDTDQPD